jgi:hypothetical protein
MGMPAGCKEKHLQEDDRMDLPDPLTEPGAPGRFEDLTVREKTLQAKSEYLTFVVESKRHMAIFGRLYKSAGIAAKWCAKK